MATIDTGSLVSQYQTFFSQELLDHAIQALVLDQFGLKAELPKNKGAMTIQWFRPAPADPTNVQALVEGVPITVFRTLVYETVSATLKQYGEAAKITDVVTMTSLFDALKQSIESMGEDCALHADSVVRNVLADSLTGLSKRYAGGANSFSALQALTQALGKVAGSDILDAVTQLRINRAPLIGGAYVAVICPQVERDVLKDSDVLDPAKYQDKAVIANAEIGMAWGARLVVCTNPQQEDEVEGTWVPTFNPGGTNTTGMIYATFVLGRNAYGVPKLASTPNPFNPSVIINDKADKSDPLNQFMTAGWKSFWNAKVLNPKFGVAVRSKSTFV